MTPTADLRPTSAPTRVSELLLPTVLSLLTRGPASAATFSTLLAARPQKPTRPPQATAPHGAPPAIPQPTLPAEQVNS